MDKICVMVGASDVEEKDFLHFYNKLAEANQEMFVIAVDNGYRFLCANHIEADMVVGDFDSLGDVPEHKCIVKHPVMKDDTDMLLGVKEGLKRGFHTFFIFGGLGKRMDHSFANIQLLTYLKERDARGILFGSSMNMTVIKNEAISFTKSFKGIVSAFALSERAEKVTIRNLKYELNEALITREFPIGVSNEFVDKASGICVDGGELLIMWESENRELPKFF